MTPDNRRRIPGICFICYMVFSWICFAGLFVIADHYSIDRRVDIFLRICAATILNALVYYKIPQQPMLSLGHIVFLVLTFVSMLACNITEFFPDDWPFPATSMLKPRA